MPQLNKGGKFVYGWSIIRENGIIQIPYKTLEEYGLLADDKVICISGSKRSGAFSVSSKKLLENSILDNILNDLPSLKACSSEEGQLLKYKGRYYFWLNLSEEGIIKLPKNTLDSLELGVGDRLMVIRGSNIAFDFVIKGPLYEKGIKSDKEIIVY